MARVSNEILANVLLENVQKLEQNTSKICKTVEEKTQKLINAKLQVDVSALQELQSSFKTLIQEVEQTNTQAIENMKKERKDWSVWYRWISFCLGFAFIGIFAFMLAYKYSVDTELNIRQSIEVENYIVPKNEYEVMKGFSINFEKDFEKYKKWHQEKNNN